MKTKLTERLTKKELIFYAVGAVLLSLSFIFEKDITNSIQLIRTPLLDSILGSCTIFGPIIIVFFLVTTLFLWEEKKREWIPTIWLSFLVTTVLVILLKVLIARERPAEAYYFFSMIIDPSFPSLHTAASFAALPILDKEFPKIKWFWVAYASIILFSRIYLNAHYLSDCIFGAMLGYGVGWIMVYIEKKSRVFRRWIWR